MAEQQTDLSHYDLLDRFSAREAACLIVGVEPKEFHRGLMLPPRAAVLEQAIDDACDRAEQRMRRALEGPALILIVPYESLASVFFDCQEPKEEGQWDALPSIRLQEFVIDLWH